MIGTISQCLLKLAMVSLFILMSTTCPQPVRSSSHTHHNAPGIRDE